MPYIKECTTLSSRFHLFAFQKQTTFSRIISQWPDIGVGWKSLEWNLQICKYKTERTHIKDLQNRWGPWSLRHDPWQPSWPMTPWQPSWLAISLIPRPTPWLTPRLKLFRTLAMLFFSINTHSTLRFTLLWFWGNLQLSKSSRALNGGAYFSDVSGWKSIPISVPGPYKCPECYRLLVFFITSNFFFAPNSHNAHAAPWAFQMDLCLSWPHWFVRQTNPWVLFLHKSIWNTHGAAGALGLFGAKKKLLVMKKQVAYTILGRALIRSLDTNRNWFSARNGRQKSSSIYGTTRLGQL